MNPIKLTPVATNQKAAAGRIWTVLSQSARTARTFMGAFATAALSLSLLTTQANDVEANYTKHCMSCHAKDGSGNTRMGKKSGAKDYRDPKVQAALKDDAALKSIRDGQIEDGKELMKPFKDKLTEDEIKELIGYFKKFGQK